MNRIFVTVQPVWIDGCPVSGAAATAFRRLAGLPPGSDNLVDIPAADFTNETVAQRFTLDGNGDAGFPVSQTYWKVGPGGMLVKSFTITRGQAWIIRDYLDRQILENLEKLFISAYFLVTDSLANPELDATVDDDALTDKATAIAALRQNAQAAMELRQRVPKTAR